MTRDRQIRDASVQALLRVELLRARLFLGRGLPAVAALFGLALLISGAGRAKWGMAMGIFGVSLCMTPPIRALAEKIDGTLDFLTSLPVSPRELALAQLVSCAGHTAFGALLWIGAIALAAPPYLDAPGGPQWYASAYVSMWLAATLLSSVAAGALTRFRTETMAWLPLALVGAVAAAVALAERIWPEGDQTIIRWLVQNPNPPLLVALGVMATALALWGAFHLLRAGYAAFRPGDGMAQGTLP